MAALRKSLLTKSRDRRARIKGRRGNVGRFAGIPHCCMDSQNYKSLGFSARALLFDLAYQFNGRNNGNLCITIKVLQERGWKSKTTVFSARDELERKGWIVTTRYGGRNRCSLYALTFKEIDDCAGKHDVTPTGRALDFWKEGNNPWLMAGRAGRAKK